MDLLWIAIILGGLFSIAGAWFDWEWFMNNSRVRGVVEVLGRRGARVFYAVLGVFLIALSVCVMLGVLG